jgi:predicted DNA-binding protein
MYTTDVYIIGGVVVRTQIYLTERQRDELAAIARTVGKKQSELIREAVDCFIEKEGHGQRESVLRETAGVWKTRRDLPDFRKVRAGWDRD